MSSESWKVWRIGEIGRIITGKTPSTKETNNFGGQYPFITIPDLDSRVYISTTQRTLSEIGAKKQQTLMLPPNTVMISCIATIGKCGITTKFSFTNQQINSVICDLNIVDPVFLYYLFCGLNEKLESVGGGGSVYTNISKSRFSDISISLPSIPNQRFIAEILSALDDKIELNRQTNATLEAIAQAIFKEWFVDFNYPGTTGEMVDSELGPIPNGWSVDNLGGFASVSSGKGLKRTEFTDEGYPILGANGQIGFTNNYLIDNEVILTGRVGTLGTLQLINKKVWISDNVLIITPIEDYYYHYLYLWLKTVDFENFNRGSTQPLITKTDLLNQQLIIPNSKTLAKFDKICRSLFSQIENNKDQSSTLMLIRDSLLPYFFRN